METILPLTNNQNIILQNERFNINNNNIDLKIFNMNNLIFRGDKHNNLVISAEPKFYGTLSSAFNYASPYLKIYQPTRILKLLSLNFTATNVVRIHNMFQELINFFTTTDQLPHVEILKILFICLQINFGLIVPPSGHSTPYFYAINKMGYTNEDIRNAILYNCKSKNASIFVYNLLIACDENKQIALNANNILPRQLIGSRMSIREMDQWIMSQLKVYLHPIFRIDGIIYDDSNMFQKLPFVCKYANSIYHGETCVPTEIAIFTPRDSLRFIESIIKNSSHTIGNVLTNFNNTENSNPNIIYGNSNKNTKNYINMDTDMDGGKLENYKKLYYKYKNKYLKLKKLN